MTQYREVSARLGPSHTTLSENLVQFADLLKAAGVEVTTAQLLAAGRSLVVIDVTSKDDTRTALAANLVIDHDDRTTFTTLFDEFWRIEGEDTGPQRLEPPTIGPGDERLGVSESLSVAHIGGTAPAAETPPQTYSPEELLSQKDFSGYTRSDSLQARRYLRLLAQQLASAPARRQRSAKLGRGLDLRRSLRLAARHDGEVLRILRTKRRIRRRKILLLCDVSGSMDVYSRFMVQFLYGMQHELRHARTFVFSTRLAEVTDVLRTGPFEDAMDRMSNGVQAWSGGTRIGQCLREFNRRYAKTRSGSRTVVVIMSDGWDRGDVEELSREMRFLSRHCHRVLWLNPLIGSFGYRPLAQGMAAALPWIDEFLPVNNLASLRKVGRTLMRLSSR